MHTPNTVREMYKSLKLKTGRAELVTENAIRNEMGDSVFVSLKFHGLIEHCMVDELGRHWYAL